MSEKYRVVIVGYFETMIIITDAVESHFAEWEIGSRENSYD
jgi:hypothetical protein